jgi:hypothetical protein
MSNTRTKTFSRDEHRYSDFGRKSPEKNRNQKKVQNALRSNNIDDLMEYGYDCEY